MNPQVNAAIFTAQELLNFVLLLQAGKIDQREFEREIARLGVDIAAAEEAWQNSEVSG